MHISRSETNLATGHNDGSIKIHDPRVKDIANKISDAHADPVACVRISPDERYIVSASKDDTIKVWDYRSNLVVNQFEHELFKLGSTSSKFGISPNSQLVCCGSKDGNLIFYDIKEGKCIDII